LERIALARKVTFTVEPSKSHHDVLTIQDAFQQAIDFFDLLTDEADKNVVWKLDMASTNSPFTCQGEPIDSRTWAGAHAQVEEHVDIIERNFRRIADGNDFDDAFPREKLDTARRLLRRTTNGIGLTKMRFTEHGPDVEVPQATAQRYFEKVLRPTESLHSYLFSRTSHRELGSVEGRIVNIGTDYGEPAVQLVMHASGTKVWCRVSPDKAEEIGAKMKAGDAWAHKRVRISGTLNYDNNGAVLRVLNGTVTYIDVYAVDLDRLEDKDFTGGYPVSEYLDRLRENDFGKQ
jgi:hypothetical protein